MKKLLILLALAGCGDSHTFKPWDMDVARKVCEPNGGLVAAEVGMDSYTAYCSNGATFRKNKGEKP